MKRLFIQKMIIFAEYYMSDPMKKSSILDNNICLRAKITTKETGHADSDVVFLFPGVCFIIGFLIQFFPGLFITSPIQNKGQLITRLNKKCLCSNGIPVIIGLADQSKRMLKTVMIAILIGTRKVELGCKL
jgi:hypothetical protein